MISHKFEERLLTVGYYGLYACVEVTFFIFKLWVALWFLGVQR